MSIGRCDDPDAHRAGATAAAAALTAPDPKLLVVFCWDGYDLAALADGIRSVAGDVPVVGCTTAGEIATDGPGDRGVVITAIGGQGFSVTTAAAAVVEGDLRAAAVQAASCLDDLDDRASTFLLLLTDGLVGDQEEVVRGAYEVAGAGIPLVGGCAGDGLQMKQTFQLHGSDLLTGAIVAAAVSSDGPIGIGVRHGWTRVGDPVMVTGSDGTRITSLDGQPALDVYLGRFDAPPEVWHDQAAFAAWASTHPFGLSRRSGEEVRYVSGADFDDRSVHCIAAVPQGGLAWFMAGDETSVLEASAGACADALTALGTPVPLGLLAFDCIARRGVLGEQGISREVDSLARAAGGAPVAGFYTYGEIARTRGTSGFHNQTLVVLALG